MKLAISNIAWKKEEDASIIDVLTHFGVGAIEVAPTVLFDNPTEESEENILKCKNNWLEKGFDIVAMQSLLFGKPDSSLFDSAQKREEMFEYLSKIIKSGSLLGAKVLVFGSPKNRQIGGLSRFEAMDIAIEFFTRLGAVAEKYGTKFCIEANAKEYNCDFITNTLEAYELVNEVSTEGFGLHVDAGVMAMNNEDYESVIETIFPSIEHFHVSEPFLMHTPEGKTPHKRLGKVLNDLGYDKCISIEMRNGLLNSNIDAVRQSVEYVIENYQVK